MNEKKYPTGFVPVNFNAVGKVFLVFGAVVIIFGFGNKLLNFLNLPINPLFVGLAFEIVGLYLVFIVPKE